MKKKAITYKDAGVNIDEAESFLKVLKTPIRRTLRPEVLGNIGGFSGLFRAGSFKRMKEPVLAASTDGVGTKLMLTHIAGRHDTIGIDLVAMCVNDVIACGAEPLLFLDYFATGRLKKERALEIMKGILAGCRIANCSLIGGETAELPGLYRGEDYDLAGFCVGVVEKRDIVDGSAIKLGDVVIGIPSSGPHSNGYSLIRRLFSKSDIKGKFKETLLKPTVIYVRPLLGLLKKTTLNGIAHITGGGFYDNISRILPEGSSVVLNPRSWDVPGIFKEIQRRSGADNNQMYRTFNMGIGMALILKRSEGAKARKILKGFGLDSYIIGEVVKGNQQVII